jgi:hypothetical protein
MLHKITLGLLLWMTSGAFDQAPRREHADFVTTADTAFHRDAGDLRRHLQRLYPPPQELSPPEGVTQYPAVGPSLRYDKSILWSIACGIEVQGRYAYLNMVEGLTILDISDPAHPVRVSQLFLQGNGGWFLQVRGRYAYLADGNAGLQIVDVQDPTHPLLVGTMDTPISARHVQVSGHLAFVSYYSNVEIIDISDPTHPAGVLRAIPGISRAYSTAVAGDVLYVGTSAGPVAVVDISDPADPHVMSYLAEAQQHEIVEVADGKLYTAGETSGVICIYDLANPSAPQFLKMRDIWSPPYDMVVIDSIVYGAGTDEAWIADVNHPPVWPDRDPLWDSLTMGLGIAVADSIVLVRDAAIGLTLLRDLGPRTNPVRVGDYNTPGFVEQISLMGNLALVPDYLWWDNASSAVNIVDLSDAAHPIVLSTVKMKGHIWDVEGQNGYAYVADNAQGLVVLDLHDPARPQQAAVHDDIFAHDLALSRTNLYVGNTLGLHIYDISDPTHPTFQASLVGLGRVRRVLADEDQAFLWTDSVAFQIVNVRDPAAPALSGHLNAEGLVPEFVLGDRAYLARGAVLQIVDISNPAVPMPLGTYISPLKIQGLCVVGSQAYLAESDLASYDVSAVRILDVWDPTRPVVVGSYQTPGQAWDIASCPGHVIVADTYGLLSLSMGFGRGDVNADGAISSQDVVYMAHYLFGQGPAPLPRPDAGDIDCSGNVTVIDVVRLVNHLFRAGPAPC